MREQVIYLLSLVAISVVNSAGQILMRWGGSQSAVRTATASPSLPDLAPSARQWLWVSRWWLLGILVTWICGLGWAWCLRKLPLVVALPIYSGLVYLLSVIGGASLLKERMTPVQVLGVVLVLIGLSLLMNPTAPQPNPVSRP